MTVPPRLSHPSAYLSLWRAGWKTAQTTLMGDWIFLPMTIDSSESEASLSGGSVIPHREPTAERVPQPSKTLDTSLNYGLGHSGTQVMAQYSCRVLSRDTETPSPNVSKLRHDSCCRAPGSNGS